MYDTIFLVHSMIDQVLEDRISLITRERELQNYNFHHFVLIDEQRDSKNYFMQKYQYESQKPYNFEQRKYIYSAEQQLLESHVKNQLIQDLTDVMPDLLIFHGGGIFRAHLPILTKIVSEIVKKFPDLEIAVENIQHVIGTRPPMFNDEAVSNQWHASVEMLTSFLGNSVERSKKEEVHRLTDLIFAFRYF